MTTATPTTGSPVEFFFVGVGKAGTTWLYEFVSRHGIASVPALKEPYLLDQPAEDLPDLMARLYDQPHRRCDFSNTYSWDPDNPVKVHAHNPDARIILTIRRPSERARSHFGFVQRNGRTSADTLAGYLAAGDEHDIVERCDYATILRRYEAVLPHEQILVLPLEQLGSAPQRYVDRLCAFMDHDPVALDDDDLQPVLVGRAARSRALSRSAKAAADALRAAGSVRLLGRLKRASVVQRVVFRSSEPTASDDDHGSPRLAELDASYERMLQDPRVVDWPLPSPG